MVMTTAALGAGAAASAGSGSLLGSLGLAAIPGVVTGIINGLFGWKANKDNEKQAEKLNAQNLAFQREQFEYQKYLNENQFQMMSSDAAKAGINPLAMSGGNVSSSSFSGSSAQGTQTPINIGDVGSFLSPVLNYKLGMQQQKLEEQKTNLELRLGYEQLREQRRNNNMVDKLQRDLSDSQSKENSKNRAKELIMFAFTNALQKAQLAETKRKNSADIQFNKDSLAELSRNNDLNYDLGLGSQALQNYLLPYQANLLHQQAALTYQNAFAGWLNNYIAGNTGTVVGQMPNSGLLGNIFGDSFTSALLMANNGLKYPKKINPFNLSDEDRKKIQEALDNYKEVRKKSKDSKK